MKISIVQASGLVGIDGVVRSVDLTGMNVKIQSVQFDTSSNTGYVEFDSNLLPMLPNMPLGKASLINCLIVTY